MKLNYKISQNHTTWQIFNSLIGNNVVKYLFAIQENDDRDAIKNLMEIRKTNKNGLIEYGKPISDLDYYSIRLPVDWIDQSMEAVNCETDPLKTFLLPPFYWGTQFKLIGCHKQKKTKIELNIKIPQTR